MTKQNSFRPLFTANPLNIWIMLLWITGLNALLFAVFNPVSPHSYNLQIGLAIIGIAELVLYLLVYHTSKTFPLEKSRLSILALSVLVGITLAIVNRSRFSLSDTLQIVLLFLLSFLTYQANQLFREPTDKKASTQSTSAASPTSIIVEDDTAFIDKNDLALQQAWRFFMAYDLASTKRKEMNSRLRVTMIFLTLISSVFAVLSTFVMENDKDVKRVMILLLVAAPAVAAGFLTYSTQFSPSVIWVNLRVAAEKIKHNIYLYRVEAGIYHDTPKALYEELQKQLTTYAKEQDKGALERIIKLYDPDFKGEKQEEFSKKARQMLLVWKVKQVEREIAGLEGGIPYLQQFNLKETEIDYPVKPIDINNYRHQINYNTHPIYVTGEEILNFIFILLLRLYNLGVLIIIQPFFYIGYLLNPSAKQFVKPQLQLKRTDIQDHDDGFSRLTWDEYLEYRFKPQNDWYIRRVNEDFFKVRRYRFLFIIITAISTALASLAALSLDTGGDIIFLFFKIPWDNLQSFVAVTSATSAAIATYMQLKMYGLTYSIYHDAANKINQAYGDWRLLNKQVRDHDGLAEFAYTVEEIFEDERQRWKKSALQAQSEVDSILRRSIKGDEDENSKKSPLENTKDKK